MAEHNCGGWCAREDRQRAIAQALKGLPNRAVAVALDVPYGTVSRILATSRRKGCLPAVPKAVVERGPTKVRIPCKCRACGEPFLAKRGSTYYCGPKCRKKGRLARGRVIAKHRPSDVGPAEPMIRVDEVGIRRRLKAAAEGGVDSASLFERFLPWVTDSAIDEAIAQAKAKGLRDPITSRWPLGVPA